MTADDFINEFGILADAPNGVQKLRELILQLAVQGKLVPQDPNEELASVLLETIAAEKARLVKEGKIRKSKPLPAIDPEDVPYPLPQGWEWVRLPLVFYSISPGNRKVKTRDTNAEGTYPVVDQGQSFVAGYVEDQGKVISIPGPVVVFGDHTRIVKIVDFDFVPGADGTKILRPVCCHEPYFYTVLRSYSLEDRGYGRHYKILTAQLFPLPPLAEQKRIVAKVDELMRLCDELEARQKAKTEKGVILNASCLNALLNVEPGKRSNGNATRIFDNFDLLYENPENVAELRKAILQVAVQGRLVPQRPSDEPASVLLKKVAAEKARLIKEGKVKRSKPLATIDPEEVPYALPKGWEWAALPWIVSNDQYAVKRGPFGSAIKKAYFVPHGYKVYEQRNAIYNDFTLGSYYIDEAKYEELKAFALHPRDTIISCSGTVGKVACAPDDIEPGVINQALLKLTLNNSVILQDFFSVMFEAYLMGTDTLSDLKGTAQKNITSVTVLRGIPLPLPPIDEQRRIVAKVGELMRLCGELESTLSQSQDDADILMSAMVHHLCGQKEVAA